MTIPGLIFINPGIEVKTIKSDSLKANRDLSQIRTHFSIETVLVHPQVRGGVPESDNSGVNAGFFGPCSFKSAVQGFPISLEFRFFGLQSVPKESAS